MNTTVFSTAADIPTATQALSTFPDAGIVLDLETTALTPWSAPSIPGKSASIGGTTIAKYLREHACTLDATPRARILSFAMIGGPAFAFDLDTLSSEQKADLFHATITDRVIIGHNLLFDLQWSLQIAKDIRPARIIDTMLIGTYRRPDLQYALRAAIADFALGGQYQRHFLHQIADPEAFFADARAAVIKADGHKKEDGASGFGSLAACALLVGLPKPDKAFQKPQNWMPSILTDAHLDYCLSDVTLPAVIAARMLGLPDDTDAARMLSALDQGDPSYSIFERAILPLLRMQRAGIRLDPQSTADYTAEKQAKAESAIDHLIALAPDLESHRDRLCDTGKGEDAALKEALDKACLARTGRPLPRTPAGGISTSADALAKEGIASDALFMYYSEAKAALKASSMATAYSAECDDNARLHPLTSIAAVTGRTSSQAPNLQNAPHDPAFRALFRAATGNKIIAIDYSAVELRIAAALAERTLGAFRSLTSKYGLTGSIDKKIQFSPEFRHDLQGLSWLWEAIGQAWQDHPTAIPARPEKGVGIEEKKQYYAQKIAYFLHKIKNNSGKGQLAEAFRHHLDPHLITALSLLASRGDFDLHSKTPTDYLTSISSEDQESLKKQYKKDRQAAKAVNFGLIYGAQAPTLHDYGITTFGLTWELEEAQAAVSVFFDLYPELALWQLWTDLRVHYKVEDKKPHIFVADYGREEITKFEKKIFISSTLSGRPTIAHKLTSGLNYQDQGSGAEMILDAITRLESPAAECLVNLVHDELVFECPKNQVELIEKQAQKAMTDAADRLLQPYDIPIEAESAIGDYWIH